MMTAGSVMTVYPATVKRQATIAEAIDLMGELDVRHVPVVAKGDKIGAIPVIHPDTNAVLGIVSYLDVLRAIGEWLDDE